MWERELSGRRPRLSCNERAPPDQQQQNPQNPQKSKQNPTNSCNERAPPDQRLLTHILEPAMKLRSDWPPFIGAHVGGRQLSRPLADEHDSLSRLYRVEMKILVCLTSSAEGGCQVLFYRILVMGAHLICCSSPLTSLFSYQRFPTLR